MTSLPSDSPSSELDLWALLRRSWDLFWQRPVLHAIAGLLVLFGGTVTLGIALGPLLVGYLRVIDRQTRGEEVELGQVMDGMSSFAPAFVTWLIVTGVFVLASMLFVVPGVVAAFVLAFALWFVAIKNFAPTAALRASWQLARNHVGPLLLLLICVAALNFLGGVVVVGVLITLPLSLILMTLGFATLSQ